MHIKVLNENFNRCRITKDMATLNDDDNGNGNGNGRTTFIKSNHNNNNNNSTSNISSSSCLKKDNDFVNSSINNNNNNEDSKSTKSNNLEDPAEIKLKKQALEKRKQELEKLLNEKSWLLQQIQKTETQILGGNYDYTNVNEFFASLAQQYKQEQAHQSLNKKKDSNDEASAGGGGLNPEDDDSSILRRKNLSRENILNNNSNNVSGLVRNSEASNRSSEYDNYPVMPAEVNFANGNNNGNNVRSPSVAIGSSISLSTIGGAQQQMPIKSALKKRSTPTPTPGHVNFLQMHRTQHFLQQQQQQHQQQLRQFSPQQAQVSHFDAISLYSVNSANVATLRQQQVAPQQQPIIVQCDKYYLSPTHQSYNDGGFIKSSQNIKQYISPLNSPKHYDIQYHLAQPQSPPQAKHLHHQHQAFLQSQRQEQSSPMQHLLSQTQSQQQFSPIHHNHHHPQPQPIQIHPSSQSQIRNLDAISLAPSYVSVDSSENVHQTRWRSQSHLPTSQNPHNHNNSQVQQNLHHQHSFHHTSITSPIMINTERDNSSKSHSSDMLATSPYYASPVYAPPPPPPPVPSASTKPKPLDDISISSANSDTQKKAKPKQWLESSLDGPAMRPTTALDSVSTTSSTSHLPMHSLQKTTSRDRAKLSSQSMSAAPRHYSISSGTREHNAKLLPHNDSLTSAGNTKLLQDDDGRYMKLSQSTSYLNKMEKASISAPYLLDTSLEISSFAYLPAKPSISSSTNVPSSTVNLLGEKPLMAAPLVTRNLTITPQPLQQPPPPRPPPLSEKPPPPPPPPSGSSASNSGLANSTPVNASLSPDIRIESPKNMTVVQQATFQPYKEVTKPFEMSDFYKYSTKFRQKENTNTGSSNINNNNNSNNNNNFGSSLANTNID